MGDVVLGNGGFTDFAWVNAKEVLKYKCIKGIKEEIKETIALFLEKTMEQEEKKKVGAGLGVILIRNGKILLGKRHSDPDKADSAFRSAGEWCLPGGKLDWGETFEEGAIREVKEETGIIISNPQVISVHNFKNEHAHFITVGLVAYKWKGEVRVMEPDEITQWQWFSLKKLPYPRYFPSFGVIKNYLKKKFYIND